jgi:hypothetical protein
MLAERTLVVPGEARNLLLTGASSLSLRDFSAELLWLGGAAALGWLAPRTFLAIQAVALLITISLRILEHKMTKGWGSGSRTSAL